MEENLEEELDMFTAVPNYRVVLDTQIQVQKRKKDLSEEELEDQRIQRLTNPDFDEEYESKDSDYEFMDISIDFSQVTGVSKGDNGEAMLWWGMENAAYNMEYNLAMALFHGSITIDEIVNAEIQDNTEEE